jgi:hypothetical protein
MPRAMGFARAQPIPRGEASVANKLSQGTFPATFLLASLIAIEADTVRLEDI